jgi:hypothetical protein
MLSQPEASKSQPFGVPGEFESVAERCRDAAAGRDGGKVEDRETRWAVGVHKLLDVRGGENGALACALLPIGSHASTKPSLRYFARRARIAALMMLTRPTRLPGSIETR